MFLRFVCLNSRFSSMIIKSNNCFFISSFDRRFAFLLSALAFHIHKQKNSHYSTKSKTKAFIQANFFCKFRSKTITSSAFIFSFSHSSFKVLSINSFVSGNVLLTAFKTAKAIFSPFCQFLQHARVLEFFTLLHYVL